MSFHCDLFERGGVRIVDSRKTDLPTIFPHLQRQLFPVRESELGPRAALDQQFCEVISLPNLGRFTGPYAWCGNGGPPSSRTGLAHAFIAKQVYQFPTPAALLDALRSRPLLRRRCGWDRAGEIPREPTFSRAFAAFAADQWPQPIHAPRGTTHAGPKLVGHVSRAATASAAQRGRPPRPSVWNSSRTAPGPRTWPTCPAAVLWAATATARGIRKAGSVTNCTWTPSPGIARSARCSPAPAGLIRKGRFPWPK